LNAVFRFSHWTAGALMSQHMLQNPIPDVPRKALEVDTLSARDICDLQIELNECERVCVIGEGVWYGVPR
jgi:hypothetical protein